MASITKRGVSYRVRVYVGKDFTGKKVVKSATYTPPDGVNAKKAELLASEFALEFERKCSGNIVYNDNMTFSQLSDWFFEYYAPSELKESTQYTYKGQLNKYIQPALGDRKLKDITPMILTKLLKDIPVEPPTVKKIYTIIQSIFRRALEQGFIRDSPCHYVLLPKRQKNNKVTSLSIEEVRRFMKLVDEKPWDEDLRRIIKLLLLTGMRSGELFGLSCDDIDFEKRMIYINHTLNDIGGKHELTIPKTDKSIRDLAMSDTVMNILLDQRRYVDNLAKALGNKCRHPEMVIVSANGNYRDRCAVLHSLKRFTAGTEFESITLHKLRHCYASILLDSGVDLKIISDTLGHCNIKVTADIYADVLRRSKVMVSNKIEECLNWK